MIALTQTYLIEAVKARKILLKQYLCFFQSRCLLIRSARLLSRMTAGQTHICFYIGKKALQPSALQKIDSV